MENFGVDDILKYLYGKEGTAKQRPETAGQEDMGRDPLHFAESQEEADWDRMGGGTGGPEPEKSGPKIFAGRQMPWAEDGEAPSAAGRGRQKEKRGREKGSRGMGIRSWIRSHFHKEHKKQPEPVQESWQGLFQEQPEQLMQAPSAGPRWDLRPEKGMDQMPVTEFGQAAAEDPATVFLEDVREREGTRRLRALDPGMEDISIDYYPFIIGKQAKLVDYQLKKDTVSRLHLRIDREGDCYQAQDLNSTNGTCIGGRPLENNESALLQIGDEVQIADVRFRFE